MKTNTELTEMINNVNSSMVTNYGKKQGMIIVRSCRWFATCVFNTWAGRCGLRGSGLPYRYHVPRAIGHLQLVSFDDRIFKSTRIWIHCNL